MNTAERILLAAQKASDARNAEVIMRVIERMLLDRIEVKSHRCMSCWYKQFYVAAKIAAHHASKMGRLFSWTRDPGHLEPYIGGPTFARDSCLIKADEWRKKMYDTDCTCGNRHRDIAPDLRRARWGI